MYTWDYPGEPERDLTSASTQALTCRSALESSFPKSLPSKPSQEAAHRAQSQAEPPVLLEQQRKAAACGGDGTALFRKAADRRWFSTGVARGVGVMRGVPQAGPPTLHP